MSGLSALYFPTGALIGLGSAAPVGPVNLLVIQRTVTAGRASALLLGLAAAVGDALFAAAAAFGVAAIARLLAEHALGLRLGGGLIMLAFAVVIWRTVPRLDGAHRGSEAKTAAAVLGLTLTNPATILFFAGAFGAVGFIGIGHDSAVHALRAAEVVAGTFAGSMLWWAIVTTVARHFRGRLTDRHLVLLNRGTAVALGVFALLAVASGVLHR